MTLARVLLSVSLLGFAALAAVPLASASIDNVYLCAAVLSPCTDSDVADVHVKNNGLSVCSIGYKGGCDPYDGDLVRITWDGQSVVVPDPCYTTACF
jgi:hypothetical protein